MNIWIFALVSVAGGCGAAARLVADALIGVRIRGYFPTATVLINLTGSFALGLLVGDADTSTTALGVLGTGVLGGFTTFSTSAVETTRMALDGKVGASALNAAGTLLGCVLLAALGLRLSG